MNIMPSQSTSNSNQPHGYPVSKIADYVAVLLIAWSISVLFLSGWGVGLLFLCIQVNLLLLINSFFTNWFWRSMSFACLLVVCAFFAYILLVLQPRERAQFSQMVSEGKQQMIAERIKQDQQQKDQLKK
jgi:hypothetical protein